MNQERIEQLAVAQAVYKLAGEIVSTQDSQNLRAECDGYYREAYELTGAKSFDVKIGSEKVGTYSVRLTKDSTMLDVTDTDAFIAWCIDNGYVEPDMKAVMAHFESTGEVPEGSKPVVYEGGDFAGGTLRIDQEKVNDALGGSLDTVYGYLEGDVSGS